MMHFSTIPILKSFENKNITVIYSNGFVESLLVKYNKLGTIFGVIYRPPVTYKDE